MSRSCERLLDHPVRCRPVASNARTSGIYLRANLADAAILEGTDELQRSALVTERLAEWKTIANS